MKILLLVLLFFFSGLIKAQVIEFCDSTDAKKIKKGENVIIKSDSAYIVSASRAKFLNEKLDELQEIKLAYSELTQNYSATILKIAKVQTLISKLIVKLQADSTHINKNLSALLLDLDKTLVELKDNNNNFAGNNVELRTETARLEKIIKDLKRQNRWIWWNGLTDKLVVMSVGIGIGFLLASII